MYKSNHMIHSVWRLSHIVSSLFLSHFQKCELRSGEGLWWMHRMFNNNCLVGTLSPAIGYFTYFVSLWVSWALFFHLSLAYVFTWKHLLLAPTWLVLSFSELIVPWWGRRLCLSIFVSLDYIAAIFDFLHSNACCHNKLVLWSKIGLCGHYISNHMTLLCFLCILYVEIHC